MYRHEKGSEGPILALHTPGEVLQKTDKVVVGNLYWSSERIFDRLILTF